MIVDIVKIGSFIKSQRTEINLTQKELAEKIGCTDKAISRWETGKGMPDSSFLVPLADTLGITVNELLTGGKIPEETFTQKSDNNLVNAIQKTEKALKQGKTVKLLLILAVAFCIFAISLLIKTILDKQNTVTYVGDFDTKNRIAVTELLLDLNKRNYYFSEDTVCTAYNIELDSKGNFKKAEITMNDEFAHEYINIILFSPSEQPQKLSYRILRQRNYISSEDGILFTDLCKFITNEEFIAEAKKYSELKEFDSICVTGQSTLYFNFDGQSQINFAKQHLFDDGELKKVSNASSMKGKYYEIGIVSFDTTAGANDTCFGVYIER